MYFKIFEFFIAEREGFEPPIPKGYTAFRMQRIQPDSAISPIYVLNYAKEIIIPLNQSQRTELEEYLETILELYNEEEYEDLVEDIVYHYCKRKFDIEREESVKLFYEIVGDQD